MTTLPPPPPPAATTCFPHKSIGDTHQHHQSNGYTKLNASAAAAAASAFIDGYASSHLTVQPVECLVCYSTSAAANAAGAALRESTTDIAHQSGHAAAAATTGLWQSDYSSVIAFLQQLDYTAVITGTTTVY